MTICFTCVAGQVTNAMIVRTPPAVVDATLKPTFPLQPFKRHLSALDEMSPESSMLSVRIQGDGSMAEQSLESMEVKAKDEVSTILEYLFRTSTHVCLSIILQCTKKYLHLIYYALPLLSSTKQFNHSCKCLKRLPKMEFFEQLF